MAGTYKLIDVVGTSPDSLAGAVKNAVAEASKTVRNMSWFEVVEQRGAIRDGKVQEFQVTVRIRRDTRQIRRSPVHRGQVAHFTQTTAGHRRTRLCDRRRGRRQTGRRRALAARVVRGQPAVLQPVATTEVGVVEVDEPTVGNDDAAGATGGKRGNGQRH